MRTALLCGTAISLYAVATNPLLAGDWYTTRVADRSTRIPSFTLDNNGNPVVVWGEPTQEGGFNLFFSRWDGIGWTSPYAFYNDPPEVYESIRFDIDNTPDGRYWVCWEAEMVAFRTALLGPDGLRIQACDVFTPGYETVSMAIGPDGITEYAFFDRPNEDCGWARLNEPDTCGFNYCTIDGGAQVGKSSCIEIDSNGVTHVTYYDQASQTMMYAVMPGDKDCAGWTKTAVSLSAQGACVLQLGPDGWPHVLIKDDQPGEWRYTHLTPDGWTNEFDSILPIYGEHRPAFAVDPYGVVHTFALDAFDGTLWYMWYDGVWNAEQLPAEYVGMEPQEVQCDAFGNVSALLRAADTSLHLVQSDCRLSIRKEGNCPGFMTICLICANPGDLCAIVYGLAPGSAGPVPGCPDLFVDIRNPKVVSYARADEFGELCVLGYVPERGCGLVLVQGINLTTCEKTDVYPIP